MFLMWTSNISGSIPVTLGYVIWGFDGSATCSSSCSNYENWTANTIGTPGPSGGFVAMTPGLVNVGTTVIEDGYPIWSAVTH